MKIARKFTTAGQDVYEAVKWSVGIEDQRAPTARPSSR